MASSSVIALATDREPAKAGLAFLDAIVTGDVATIDTLLAPHARWWAQGWGWLERDAFVSSLTGTITRASIRGMKILSVTSEEDRVAIEALGSFTFPQGEYRNTYLYLLRVSGGRIVEGREFLDTREAARFFD